MRPLEGHCTRGAALAVSLILGAALVAGSVRVLPWLLSPAVPLQVSWPFARALLAVAGETAMLIGIPLGFAYGTASFTGLGEARALFALGESPLRLIVGAWRSLAAWGLGAVCLVVVLDTDASVPGRFAQHLIDQGRESCESHPAARTAWVPMVGVTWLCFSDAPPRVVGELPRSRGRAWFSAANLRPSEDLRRFDVQDLRLSTRGADTGRNVRLRAKDAVVAGLAAWGRPPKMSVAERASIVSLSALALGVFLVWLGLISGSGRFRAFAAAAAGGICALNALHWLDRGALGPLAYALLPIGATLATLAAHWLLGMVGRLKKA